ncbi:hypothetical protein ACU18_15370 [Arthrobacter sp. ZBG10]|nr:hypothetical protein ACU18_15370 [Arthrobacter sp. ZBG10]
MGDVIYLGAFGVPLYFGQAMPVGFGGVVHAEVFKFRTGFFVMVIIHVLSAEPQILECFQDSCCQCITVGGEQSPRSCLGPLDSKIQITVQSLFPSVELKHCPLALILDRLYGADEAADLRRRPSFAGLPLSFRGHTNRIDLSHQIEK